MLTPIGVGSDMVPEDFSTKRLSARNWQPDVSSGKLRPALEAELAEILTPAVLAPLPPSMQLQDRVGAVTAWVDARRAECDVLLVRQNHDGHLVGLLILAPNLKAGEIPVVHVGYLIAQAAWGQGYATELLSGLIASVDSNTAIRLVAGVERSNPASARVLQKSGFVLMAEHPSEAVEMYYLDIGQLGH